MFIFCQQEKNLGFFWLIYTNILKIFIYILYVFNFFPFWSVCKLKKMLFSWLYSGVERLFFIPMAAPRSIVFAWESQTQPQLSPRFFCSADITHWKLDDPIKLTLQAIRKDLSGLITDSFMGPYLLFQFFPRRERLHWSGRYHNPL